MSPGHRKKRAASFRKIEKDALKKTFDNQSYERQMKKYIRNLLGRKKVLKEGAFSLIWEKKRPWTISRSFAEVSSVIHRCTPPGWNIEITREPEDEYMGWLFHKERITS